MADEGDGAHRSRTIHGLRHRGTGRLMRLSRHVTVLSEEPDYVEDVRHALTDDPDEPLFDAGSREALSLLAVPSEGASPRAPLLGGYRLADLEPVLVEEVFTRTVAPMSVVFEEPAILDVRYAVEAGRSLARRVEGLGAILDAVDLHRAQLEGAPVRGPDGEAWTAGPFLVAALIVPGDAADLPEDLPGRLAVGTRPSGIVRRALGAVALPADMLHLVPRRPGEPAPASGVAVVCLDDARPLPEGLLDALAPARGPAPR